MLYLKKSLKRISLLGVLLTVSCVSMVGTRLNNSERILNRPDAEAAILASPNLMIDITETINGLETIIVDQQEQIKALQGR